MGLFDFFKTNKVTEVVNLDKRKPSGSDVTTRIVQTQLVRTSQDVKKWRNALTTAESTIRPDRQNLLRIYKDVILDPHLSAITGQRTNAVLSRGFKLINANDEVDFEKTKILKSQWFEQFLNYAVEAKYYGFSLVEFGNIVNDEFEEIKLVPREYVIPEEGKVATSLARNKVIDYTRPPFNQWTLFIGSKTDLGLLNKATPIVLWKRLVQATWAEYNELFGIPLRVGRTNTRDPYAREKMEEMLENLGSSAWGLFDEDDKIEIISPSTSGSVDTFERFINLADEQLSKLFLGQTMTTDNGSSRSQSEVHERVMQSFTGADLRWLSYLINNKLLPFLNAKGFAFEGLSFEWDLEEKLSLKERFEIEEKLLNFYNISPEYIESVYGTPVEEKEFIPQPQNSYNITNDISKLYEGFFKHEEGCTCGNC